MRILYIGTYRNKGRDAHYSENLARSLVASDNEVVCRSTLDILPAREVHSDIAATEMLSLRGLDVVIQDVYEPVHMSNTPWKNLYLNPYNEFQHIHYRDYLENTEAVKIKETEGTFRAYSVVDGPSNWLYGRIKDFLQTFRPYDKASHTIFTKSKPEEIDELCRKARAELNCTKRPKDIIVPLPEDQFSFPTIHWYGDVMLASDRMSYVSDEAWGFGNLLFTCDEGSLIKRYREWLDNPIKFNLTKSKALMHEQLNESPGMIGLLMEEIERIEQ